MSLPGHRHAEYWEACWPSGVLQTQLQLERCCQGRSLTVAPASCRGLAPTNQWCGAKALLCGRFSKGRTEEQVPRKEPARGGNSCITAPPELVRAPVVVTTPRVSWKQPPNLLTVWVRVLRRGAIRITPPASRAHCRIPRPSCTSGRDRHMPALATTKPDKTKSSVGLETRSWCMLPLSSGRVWLPRLGPKPPHHLKVAGHGCSCHHCTDLLTDRSSIPNELPVRPKRRCRHNHRPYKVFSAPATDWRPQAGDPVRLASLR